MARKFERCIESFVCSNCGFAVTGNGYTNHCPKCLWSKHVDVNPGDRAAECRGLMEPIAATLEHGDTILIHRCSSCGETRKNKTVPQDEFEAVLELLGKPAQGPRRKRRLSAKEDAD